MISHDEGKACQLSFCALSTLDLGSSIFSLLEVGFIVVLVLALPDWLMGPESLGAFLLHS